MEITSNTIIMHYNHHTYEFKGLLYCIYIPKYIEINTQLNILVINDHKYLKYIIDHVKMNNSTNKKLYTFPYNVYPSNIVIKNPKTNIDRMFGFEKLHPPGWNFSKHEILTYHGCVRSEDYLNNNYSDVNKWKLFIKLESKTELPF